MPLQRNEVCLRKKGDWAIGGLLYIYKVVVSLRTKLATGPFLTQSPIQFPGFSEGLLVWLE